MAGPLAVAAVQGIGSILGGLFGRSKTKTISAGDNFYSHVGGIINAARDFGFNPLTLLTNGQAIGPSSTTTDNSAFGAGIANAFAIAGDAMLSKRNTAAKLNQYQQQNQRLQTRLNAITLRPPVPGVYGRNSLPSDPEVYGADPSAPSGPWLRPDGLPALDAVRKPSYNWTDPDIRSESDDASRVPRKPLFLQGYQLDPVSGTSDAEAIGSRYGEDFLSPSWFAGWGAFGTDTAVGVGRAAKERAIRITKAYQRDIAKVRASFESRNGYPMNRPATAGWMDREFGRGVWSQ